ncbi:MAG: diversity-generating retroelement protein Avd [Anaerolineaceae bacterium]|nr:diversity-generating retroelement protein Avd [Anaerolineaceae bacterium]
MSQSPIFIKTESFMIWFFQHTAKFPKHERFRLAKRMDDALFEFHSNLLISSKQLNKLPTLKKADAELDKLRTYLRISLEMKYTSEMQYHYCSEQVKEIGKILGGWIKKVSSGHK